MAIRDFGTDTTSGVVGFSCDTDADVANLPTTTSGSADPTSIYQKPIPQGSWAIIIEDGTARMLMSTDEWVEI